MYFCGSGGVVLYRNGLCCVKSAVPFSVLCLRGGRRGRDFIPVLQEHTGAPESQPIPPGALFFQSEDFPHLDPSKTEVFQL